MGIFYGFIQNLNYVFIDPRRHNINVWAKDKHPLIFKNTKLKTYQSRAKALPALFVTNGPQMKPPFFSFLLLKWKPYGRVISGGVILHKGASCHQSYFGRKGSGTFKDYVIASGPAQGIEAIGGLKQICVKGEILVDKQKNKIEKLIILSLLPLKQIQTKHWQSLLPYLSSYDVMLDGLIVIVTATKIKSVTKLLSQLTDIGVSDAVMMAENEAALAGVLNKLHITCSEKQDKIQQFGFYCI